MVKEETQKFNLCVKAALKKKAYDLIALDIKGISSFADYFIICSATSNRQAQAIASSIELDLKKERIYSLGIEGFNEGEWILLDYDEVIIHVFHQPLREFYELERLWADAPRIEIKNRVKEKVENKSSSDAS